MSEEEIIEEMQSLSPSEEAIQGLLDLYNKEKEKNKKLEDKIKGKIEELEKDYKEYENSNEWEIFDETKYAYEVLQELLEE